MTDSPRIGIDDELIPGYSSRVEPEHGAGGEFNESGDYIFQELKQEGRLEGGMWGIFRVRSDPEEFDVPISALPDRSKQ